MSAPLLSNADIPDRLMGLAQLLSAQKENLTRSRRTGARRRVEVISDLRFLVETEDFPALAEKLERFGAEPNG